MGSIVGGIIGSVGAIIGAKKGIKAAKKSGEIQSEAALEAGGIQSVASLEGTAFQTAAAEDQLALFENLFKTTSDAQAPFIEGGSLALDALLSELGLGDAPTVGGTTTSVRKGFFGPRETVTTGGEPFAGFQESPGFKFAFQQGVNAVDASAAAGGSLFSGSTLEDLTKFGQGFASQERGGFLDRLRSLVSVGQTGVGQFGASAAAFGTGASGALGNIGNSQASGIFGAANATASGIIGAANAKSSGVIAANDAFQLGLNNLSTSLGQITGGIIDTPGFPTLSF